MYIYLKKTGFVHHMTDGRITHGPCPVEWYTCRSLDMQIAGGSLLTGIIDRGDITLIKDGNGGLSSPVDQGIGKMLLELSADLYDHQATVMITTADDIVRVVAYQEEQAAAAAYSAGYRIRAGYRYGKPDAEAMTDEHSENTRAMGKFWPALLSYQTKRRAKTPRKSDARTKDIEA